MKQANLENEACALWAQLWCQFYQVDDSKWAEQAPRLKELTRLAAALSVVCAAMEGEQR